VERILREQLKGGVFEELTPDRSKIMGTVKSRGNKSTEVRLRFALVRTRIRGWRLHPKDITGKPDFFFDQANLAIFVDGCFWHGCERCGHIPKKNNKFWKMKIERNKSRDKELTQRLKRQGIRVLRFWEHDLRSNLDACIQRITALV
jgi:DNA mismatch endonuclease, patch repair protein